MTKNINEDMDNSFDDDESFFDEDIDNDFDEMEEDFDNIHQGQNYYDNDSDFEFFD